MAQATFLSSTLRPMIDQALKNLKKAIDIESKRKDDSFFSAPKFSTISSYSEELQKLEEIDTLMHGTWNNVTLIAHEYSRIKYWAEWKEPT